jgi:hypothetical protein
MDASTELDSLSDEAQNGKLLELNCVDLYILDNNLLIHYFKNTLPGWKEFVDRYYEITNQPMYLRFTKNV